MTASESKVALVASLISGAAVVAVVFLIYFQPFTTQKKPADITKSTYGRILVDSPEVYTRERMVNDRFRQEAWLLEGLSELEKPGVQGVLEGSFSRAREASLSFSANTPDSAPADEAEPDTVDGGAATGLESGVSGVDESPPPALTAIEAFRVQQSFREEVRNAIIENQLDDRHDLAGNTLYRLKFDASVIPGNDSSAWAEIRVNLKRKKTDKDEEELREVYERWMDDLREQVDATYRKRIETAKSGDFESRVYKIGIGLISRALEQLSDAELETLQAEGQECLTRRLFSFDSDSEPQRLSYQILKYSEEGYKCMLKNLSGGGYCPSGECAMDLLSGDVLSQVVDAFGATLGGRQAEKRLDKRSVTGGVSRSRNVSSSEDEWGPIPNDQTDKVGQKFVTFSPQPDGASILVDEYIEVFYAIPVELNDIERDWFNSYNAASEDIFVRAIPASLKETERRKFLEYEGAPVDDSESLSIWALNLWCGDMDTVTVQVMDREYSVCGFDAYKLDLASTDLADPNAQGVVSDFEFEILDDGPQLVKRVEPEDAEIRKAWTAVLGCADLEEIVVKGRSMEVCASVKSYFTGISSKDDKFVETGELTDIAPVTVESTWDGLPAVSVRVGFKEFRKKLRTSDDRKFLFSYAVTPRESSEQYSSSSRVAEASQLRAGAAAGFGDTQVGTRSGRSSSSNEKALIIQRRPLVVGVASHGNWSKEQSAEFGWLIGPKLVIDSQGRAIYRHLPSQNSLAALVSAPSWWRRADIEVTTGWLDEHGQMIETQAVEFPISLPGDREEITSALLLGGKRPAPNVDSVEPVLVKIGEEAKFLIEGQNLWRSTVVTIGAQSSRKIFVLPNMNGIIAEFGPIESQLIDTTADKKAALRVWTSEGVASSKPIEIVK